MIPRPARMLPALCLCTAISAMATENGPPMLRDMSDASFRVYDRPGPLKYREGLPAAELLAVDLRRNSDGPPITESLDAPGGPLRVTLYWKPISENFAKCTVITAIRAKGSAPSPGYLVKATPVPTPPGEVGRVTVQSLELSLPSRRFVGNGVLSVVQEFNGERVTHFLRAIRVEPEVWKSNLPDSSVASIFGEDALRSRAAFRIGPDTSVTIPLTHASDQETTRRIGIISAVDWGDGLHNGEIVARIRTASGTVLPLVLGKDTLRIDDTPDPDASFAGTISAQERDGAYVGAVLSGSLLAAGPLVVEYAAASGYLDVIDVVVLPDNSTGP